MMIKRLLLVLALVAALAFVVAGCGDANDSSSGDSGAAASSDGGSKEVSGNSAGAGSSAQDAAMQAWIAGLQSTSPDATVSYDPVGSGGGRDGGGRALRRSHGIGTAAGGHAQEAQRQPANRDATAEATRDEAHGAPLDGFEPATSGAAPTRRP